MAEKLSFYLSDKAVRELDRLADGLAEIAGCPISRSAAIDSLLVFQAGIYLESRRHQHRAARYYESGMSVVEAVEKSNGEGGQ